MNRKKKMGGTEVAFRPQTIIEARYDLDRRQNDILDIQNAFNLLDETFCCTPLLLDSELEKTYHLDFLKVYIHENLHRLNVSNALMERLSDLAADDFYKEHEETAMSHNEGGNEAFVVAAEVFLSHKLGRRSDKDVVNEFKEYVDGSLVLAPIIYVHLEERLPTETYNEFLLRLFDNAKGVFAVENNKRDCIKILKKSTKCELNARVKALKTKYPQGGERSLIYAVTGRKINSKKLPADAGCIVHNVDTIYSIYRAVYEGKPLIKRVVTVTGDAIKEPKNFEVRLGTSVNELIEGAGGFVADPEKIISGGPMMGFSFFNTEVPVVKGSSSVLAFTKDDVAASEISPCIRCGRCASACPEYLLPMKLAECAAHNDMEGFKKLNGMECVECGCCSYVCPAKRQITQSMRSMKKIIIEESRKK